MAGQPSSSSMILWAWVIEELANFKELDIITLINLFNNSPKITNGIGSKSREMVSFRILERLFDSDTRPVKRARCAQKSGVTFAFSERCEDVLQQILEKMHEPNVWNESERSKWYIQPFIAHKRSCMLKSDLTRLKETLMEGKSPDLTTLKQKFKSQQSNQQETEIHDVNRDVNINNINNNQQQNPSTNDKVCQDTSNDGNKKGEEDECYKKELDDILAKKEAFFSSICKGKNGITHSKDSNRCIKCNKGGQLLVCNSNNCLFMFHDSCLVSNSPVELDSSGRFYCPFCKYSQSIMEYCVAKKKTCLARNDLASFNKRNMSNVGSEIPNGDLNPDLVNEISEVSGSKGCNEKSPENEDIVDHSCRSQNQHSPSWKLEVIHRRRVPVPWTQLEEETLKKWVEKFASSSGIRDGGFPWRRILELGASKFQKSRTPVDLKDKWRNMQKAIKKSK